MPLLCALAAALLTLLVPSSPRADQVTVIRGGGQKRRAVRSPREIRVSSAGRRWRRRRLVRLERGDGLEVRSSGRAWGTRIAVYQLTRVLALYERRYPDARPIKVRDLSRRGGGAISGHLSHRTGRDVDVPLVLNRPELGYVDATPRTLDLERTLFLIRAFADSCDVEMIFLDRTLQRALIKYADRRGVSPLELEALFQYPSRRGRGLVRHWRNHKNHMHLRFRREGAPLANPSARSYCRQRGPANNTLQ